MQHYVPNAVPLLPPVPVAQPAKAANTFHPLQVPFTGELLGPKDKKFSSADSRKVLYFGLENYTVDFTLGPNGIRVPRLFRRKSGRPYEFLLKLADRNGVYCKLAPHQIQQLIAQLEGKADSTSRLRAEFIDGFPVKLKSCQQGFPV